MLHLKDKSIEDLILDIPTGSVPVKVSKEVLYKMDTLQSSEGINYISHKDLFEHFGNMLNKNKAGISFSPMAIETSNKVIMNINDQDIETSGMAAQRVSVRKVLAKFKSDVEFDGKYLTAAYAASYRENSFELCYALGFDVKICTNGNVLADHFMKRGGKTMQPQELDPYLTAWMTNYNDSVVRFKDFSRKLDETYLSEKNLNEFLGKMIQDVLLRPQKVTDTNVYTTAVKLLNASRENLFPRDDRGGLSLWNLYNHFTDALKNEELSSRFKKHGNIASYFEQKALEVV
jgi:hypothetical protein